MKIVKIKDSCYQQLKLEGPFINNIIQPLETYDTPKQNAIQGC